MRTTIERPRTDLEILPRILIPAIKDITRREFLSGAGSLLLLVRENPIYRQLDVAREGGDIFLDVNEPLAGALSFSTVLSLPFLLDELVPRLATAVAGASTTGSGTTS